MSRGVQNNIKKLYVIKASKWFMLFMPIVVPFYESNGLSLQDLFVLQAIYSIAIVALEIPSGYFADILGRRLTLILGTIAGFFGFLTYCFTGGFWGFLIAEIFLGFGASLISGADSAMLYDSLSEMKREKDYLKEEGRITALGNFSESIAGIAGGLLATITLRTPYFFQAGIAFLAIPFALSLVEPVRYIHPKNIGMKFIFRVVKYAMIENKLLRLNIVFSSVIGASTLTMAWFVQPYFKLIGIPLGWYGFLWTSLNLTVAITSFYAYRFERRLGEKGTIILITMMIAFGYFSVGLVAATWGLAFFYLFYFIRGIATPALKNYINNLTSSDIRATVLSIRSLLIRIIFAIIGPILGWLTDIYNLQTALLLAGTTFFIMAAFSVSFYLKVKYFDG